MYVYVYINGVIDAGKSDGKKDGKEDLRQAGEVMLKTQKVMVEKRRVGINSGWRMTVGEWRRGSTDSDMQWNGYICALLTCASTL